MTSRSLILIVDEQHHEAFGCEQLRTEGYCVVHARGATAALSLIEQDEPDLIIAVDRAGREFVRLLEDARVLLDCPLIVIGGHDSRQSRRFPTKCLLRPVAGAQLLLEIRNLGVTPAQHPETD
jgi:DNA-binding response OmpR family regulator